MKLNIYKDGKLTMQIVEDNWKNLKWLLSTKIEKGFNVIVIIMFGAAQYLLKKKKIFQFFTFWDGAEEKPFFFFFCQQDLWP